VRPWVVDASVVGASLFREQHALAARAVLESGGDLYAPDFLYTELASVIWKRHRRGLISREEALGLLMDARVFLIQVTPSTALVDRALRLALHTGCTVYDCLYLAMAEQTDTVMLTCDQRLVSALAGTLLENHVKWLGES
jgi:predicted nucleic acid-binding protein